MIFLFFKPMNIKEHKFKDVPMFQISDFTMHELDNHRLVTLMKGSSAFRYSDRYIIENIDYTDNTKDYVATMRAKHGVYKNEIVDLKDDIFYAREDGLIFTTSKARYNRKTNITNVDAKYILYRVDDNVTGSSFIYNNKLNKGSSENVYAIYQLQESKK